MITNGSLSEFRFTAVGVSETFPIETLCLTDVVIGDESLERLSCDLWDDRGLDSGWRIIHSFGNTIIIINLIQ